MLNMNYPVKVFALNLIRDWLKELIKGFKLSTCLVSPGKIVKKNINCIKIRYLKLLFVKQFLGRVLFLLL